MIEQIQMWHEVQLLQAKSSLKDKFNHHQTPTYEVNMTEQDMSVILEEYESEARTGSSGHVNKVAISPSPRQKF